MSEVPSHRKPSKSDKTTRSRRAALARLGLGAAAVYSAPTILRIDRESQALAATPCPPFGGPAKGKGPAWCRTRGRGRGR